MPQLNKLLDAETLNSEEEQRIPMCKHFGDCGGCSLQHLSKKSYKALKTKIIADVMKRLECDGCDILDMAEIGIKSRRRVSLKVASNKDEISIGFYEPKTHDVVDISMCPVTDDRIVHFITLIKECLASLKKPGNISSIDITALDVGLDIIVITKGIVKDKDKKKLTSFAQEQSQIARLSTQLEESKKTNEVLHMNAVPMVDFGGVSVELPVNAFLQATNKGQDAITAFVLEHIGDADKVADFFCGLGTYTFPLLKNVVSVSAYEGNKDMTVSLFNAARKAGVENRILTEARDLFANPLKAEELNRYDAVVINPPRAGAKAQTEQLAKSDVKKIVMVSCNPKTFEKDAKLLLDGGYKLIYIMPIDQFYWSKHLELTSVFIKA
jgi:23S rRNA (uracil1939-C5)-methyltransferase